MLGILTTKPPAGLLGPFRGCLQGEGLSGEAEVTPEAADCAKQFFKYVRGLREDIEVIASDEYPRPPA